MSATMTDLTRSDEKDLARLHKSLQKEARVARKGGLTDKAAELEEQAATVAEKLQAAGKARREQRRQRRQAKREAEARHEKAMKARAEQEERRTAAQRWLRSAMQFNGGRPVPAGSTLQQAEAAGHDPDDVEAVAVRVRPRRRGQEGEFLAIPGTFLRGRYLEA